LVRLTRLLAGGDATTIATRRIGPTLAFERVWEENRLPGRDRTPGEGAQS